MAEQSDDKNDEAFLMVGYEDSPDFVLATTREEVRAGFLKLIWGGSAQDADEVATELDGYMQAWDDKDENWSIDKHHFSIRFEIGGIEAWRAPASTFVRSSTARSGETPIVDAWEKDMLEVRMAAGVNLSGDLKGALALARRLETSRSAIGQKLPPLDVLEAAARVVSGLDTDSNADGKKIASYIASLCPPIKVGVDHRPASDDISNTRQEKVDGKS